VIFVFDISYLFSAGIIVLQKDRVFDFEFIVQMAYCELGIG